MSICALGEAKGMWVNMKKILYIAISSQTGGVPRHILQALRHAKEYGYKVAVAAPDDGDYYPWFRQQAFPWKRGRDVCPAAEASVSWH